MKKWVSIQVSSQVEKVHAKFCNLYWKRFTDEQTLPLQNTSWLIIMGPVHSKMTMLLFVLQYDTLRAWFCFLNSAQLLYCTRKILLSNYRLHSLTLQKAKLSLMTETSHETIQVVRCKPIYTPIKIKISVNVYHRSVNVYWYAIIFTSFCLYKFLSLPTIG